MAEDYTRRLQRLERILKTLEECKDSNAAKTDIKTSSGNDRQR